MIFAEASNPEALNRSRLFALHPVEIHLGGSLCNRSQPAVPNCLLDYISPFLRAKQHSAFGHKLSQRSLNIAHASPPVVLAWENSEGREAPPHLVLQF